MLHAAALTYVAAAAVPFSSFCGSSSSLGTGETIDMAKTVDRGLENREIVLDVLMEVLEKGAFIHQVLGQAL